MVQLYLHVPVGSSTRPVQQLRGFRRGKVPRPILERMYGKQVEGTIRSTVVIGPDGTQLGIMATKDALKQAQDQGLDLVEISPNARPPVCRILDFGKFQYEEAKNAKRAKKKPLPGGYLNNLMKAVKRDDEIEG